MNITILEMPSDTEYTNLPQDVQAAIRSVGGDFVHGIMPGTRIYQLKKVVNSVVYSNLDTIEQMIASFGLDWVVLGMQTAMVVPPVVELLLPLSFIDYCADTYDSGGNPFRPTVIPPLAKFSGHEDWVLP